MQSRKRVWLLFTAIIIAVFAMVGCIPEITPDRTPPDVTAKTVTFSPTTINVGDSLQVEVQVSATDKRSNLKNAQITLKMQKNGGAFTEVASATVPFPENVKTGSIPAKIFPLAGANFDVGGIYNFRAEIKVSDIKNNISQEAVIADATGSLQVQGTAPGKPVTTIEFVPSPRNELYLPETFDLTVSVTKDPSEPIFGYLKAELYFEGEEEDPEWSNSVTLSGTTGIELSEDDITVDIGDSMQKDIYLKLILKDKDGNPLPIEDEDGNDLTVTHYIISKGDIALIVEELHLGNTKSVIGAQTVGTFEENATSSDVPTETDPVYELPFGITTLTFEINPLQEIPTDKAELYIYSDPVDIFNQNEQFKRGETDQITLVEDGLYRTSIEMANLSADNAKWLVLFIEGAAKPWYVWKISAADHVTTPVVEIKDVHLIQEIIEGKPIVAQMTLKDELLLSLEDLQIRFGNNLGYTSLETLIEEFNTQIQDQPDDRKSELGWPTDDSWRFAVRYHTKVIFENYNETAEATRNRDLEPDPDPKVVYAISDPVIDDTTDHVWYRFDAQDGTRLNWTDPEIPNNMLYFFGVPDRQIEGLNRPEYITDLATMTVHVYPEFVVVHKDSPTDVLYVSDAALGAGNRYILQAGGGYKQYDIVFSAKNAREVVGTAQKPKVFPVYADNTSPEIELTYGTENTKKYFADRRPEDLVTNDAKDRIAPPMFFVDTISLKAGQSLSIDAIDNVALYDFAVLFTGTNTTQYATQSDLYWRLRGNMPEILKIDDAIDLPVGYDFIYREVDPEGNPNIFYTGQNEANKNKEDLPTQRLNEILIDEKLPIVSKVIYTDIYPNAVDIGPENPGEFKIDDRYELYENYTWSGVRNANINLIDKDKQEQYFTRTQTSISKDINMPSVPGTYWVWLIARDRGAQDSWLFDYENDRVNIDPLTGNPEIYSQNVMYNQNNYFTEDNNLEDAGSYYENSESESDAPMIVLLRVIVETHSTDIQRLDIHEPCLVSYPDEDDLGKVWFAHSYNVLQLDGQTKVAEFDEGESMEHLPRDMYPIFKRQEQDWDAGNKFGLSAGLQPLASNLWHATETYNYGNYTEPASKTYEAVPVVGGNDTTTFRVKTHEDIEKVRLELIDKKVWTVKQYSSVAHTLLDSIVIEKDPNSSKSDGKGQGGYWEWELDLSSYPGFANIETYCSIVVKAYNDKDAQFFEQWQWPIFVDTKGPEVKMFATQHEGEPSIQDHLEILHMINEGCAPCCQSFIDEWAAFQVEDRGGLMFEYNKGFAHSELENVLEKRTDRKIDLCDDRDGGECGEYYGHMLSLSDTMGKLDRKIFQTQAIDDPENYLLYGFPSDHPSTQTTDATPSSLKYLTEEVVEYENLETSAKWHQYYTNTTWGNYYGDNWKDDPIEIPTIAFFNNIRLDWTGAKETEITFKIRDELGNDTEWEACVQNEELPTLDASVTATNTTCREATITVSATMTGDEIEKLYVSETKNGSITEVTIANPLEEEYDPAVPEEFKASDFLMPAFATERKFRLEFDTSAGQHMATNHTVVATYAGATVTVGINPIGEIGGDIGQELEDAGLNDLALQLYREFGEGYYVKGVKGLDSTAKVVTVNFTAEDDNIDKYYISHDSTICTGISSVTVVPNIAEAVPVVGMRNEATSVTETATITQGATFGSIIASIAGLDCPESTPNWDATDTIKIWYQDLDTFILSVDASPSGATESVTEIVVELQSDLLFEGLDDLKSIFTFERASDGVELTIEEASACNNILGTDTDWETITAGTGARRNQKFWFKVGSFNLSSPRASGDPIPLEKTENGITCKMWDFWAPAIGHYNSVEE